MDFLALDTLAILFGIAILSGWVDSIAGGGGLIALPALLSAGLSPAQALATNKLQGSFGTFAATANFVRKGHLKLTDIWPMILLTFAGSATGTILIQNMDAAFLVDIIPFMLLAVGLYFLFQPKIGEDDQKQRVGIWGFSFIAGFTIGFYDGFFGPGTGSFFAIAFIALMGFNILKATAHTKALNFTSNIASLAFFIVGGQVVWIVGLVMAMGQMIGGFIGSHMSMKHGPKIIRPLLVIISFAMTAKLVWSTEDHIIRDWVSYLLG
ncbi:TSUP family transporter [Terasakiella sp. A23]|uniref:TSUP family transporter n=1 Tax=Terasakiella sp. FCG-A23 TaxID=3080561 RepID=UPI0029536AD0|nr:TSUP family transporter [Terasakiella sp. A23]MDV7339219.1 TSUP family transporter [Terasakiella sp. A23]